jgi:hypothetical protein
MSDNLLHSASLDGILRARDIVLAYLSVEPGCSVATAVDLVCDSEGIPDDRDRRVIRRGVERRLEIDSRKAGSG